MVGKALKEGAACSHLFLFCSAAIGCEAVRLLSAVAIFICYSQCQLDLWKRKG